MLMFLFYFLGDNIQANKNVNTQTGKTKGNKTKKRKLGENISEEVSNLTPEDMLSWAEFKLPPEIVKALMELGFKQPTKIQQLSLPAAIHGNFTILLLSPII